MELGKQVIHPGQIDVVQSAFTPSPQSIEWAEELIELFNKHQLSGKVCHYGLGFTIIILHIMNQMEGASHCKCSVTHNQNTVLF